jgi:hypothetical protein
MGYFPVACAASSKAPAIVLPSWLPAMNSRSRCALPASWKSICLG